MCLLGGVLGTVSLTVYLSWFLNIKKISRGFSQRMWASFFNLSISISETRMKSNSIKSTSKNRNRNNTTPQNMYKSIITLITKSNQLTNRPKVKCYITDWNNSTYQQTNQPEYNQSQKNISYILNQFPNDSNWTATTL